MSANANDDRFPVPVLEGAIAGVAAWVVGYVLTYLVVSGEVRESPLNRVIEAFSGEPATYEMVGWVFYNAHLVETVFRDVPILGTQAASYIGGEEGFSLVLFAVPIGLLFASGIALATYRGASEATEGLVVGLATIPGYLVLMIAGVFIFEVTVGGASGAPDTLPAIVFAGVIYPAVFAGTGGVVGAVLGDRP
ncbi:hypothetical protein CHINAEXTREME_20175 [Halobiforma lacisalsi AJ5]|uniref:DUF7978 domain-containing protein n=1 Tax=Natronobacterium lacisalsi AJ5 TaxID=358396 RepID=M0LQM2_NATLA|nr:hypothetical protein [Halobiforma lacisalsi]APW99943.1 hypothetical protein CHINAEXTREME_20175 [Halobiforma lacisalsi AJ5]EMA35867.1 hypothetical protein C445_03388 [Halobiforma lacisalsi AJ5]